MMSTPMTPTTASNSDTSQPTKTALATSRSANDPMAAKSNQPRITKAQNAW